MVRVYVGNMYKVTVLYKLFQQVKDIYKLLQAAVRLRITLHVHYKIISIHFANPMPFLIALLMSFLITLRELNLRKSTQFGNVHAQGNLPIIMRI